MSVLRWCRGSRVGRGLVPTVLALALSAVMAWPQAPWQLTRTAKAAPPPKMQRVALFVVPRTTRLAGDASVLQSFMREELGKLAGVIPVGANGDPKTSAYDEAGALVEAGYRALNDRDGAAAERSFQDAYNKLNAYRGPFDRRLMARALKGLGVALVMTGQGDQGARLMGASLNVWPDQQVAEYGWTLDTRTAFRDVERRRSDSPRGALEISTEPEGAQIRVDGVLRGFSPIEVGDLAAGQHFVEAVLDGRRRTTQFVDVQPGEGSIAYLDLEATKNEATFSAALRNVARLVTKATVRGPLRDMSKITGADAVIAVQVNKRRDTYSFDGTALLADGTPTEISQSVAADANLRDGLRAMLATALGVAEAPDATIMALDGPPQASVMSGQELFIDPNDPIFKEEEKKEKEPITDQWWFWAIAGGVTAGLVVGGVLLFSGSDEGSGPSGAAVLNLNRLP